MVNLLTSCNKHVELSDFLEGYCNKSDTSIISQHYKLQSCVVNLVCYIIIVLDLSEEYCDKSDNVIRIATSCYLVDSF